MLRILLPFSAAFTACTPAPEDALMHQTKPAAATDASGPGNPDHPGQAAQASIPEAVSAAENRLATTTTDSAADALGRRLLSTAFVRAGPDGLLTVQLRSGEALVLRNVVMRPADYCGTAMSGDRSGGTVCGPYGTVAAAAPGAATPVEPVGAAATPLRPRNHPGLGG